MVSRAAAPMDGNASPRNPSVRIDSRSSLSSFDVAWRSTLSSRSARVMPSPSSLTRISRRPPPSVRTSIRRAPASSAFSTSSLTTLAGRSTTSPAAIRLTTASDNWRTGMVGRFDPVPTLPAQTGTCEARSGALPDILVLVRASVPGFAAAQALDGRAMLFPLQPLPTLRLGHFRRAARGGLHRRLADHREQPVPRIVAVAFLGAMLLGDDHDDALFGQSLARKTHQPQSDIVRQRGRVARIKAKLHSRRHLVDVLASGAGRAHKGFRKLGFVDGDRVGDLDHFFRICTPALRSIEAWMTGIKPPEKIKYPSNTSWQALFLLPRRAGRRRQYREDVR